MLITRQIGPQDDLAHIKELEWIETNGLGGWSGSTICGLNTRKYHGVLVPSLDPPVDRRVYLSRLDETILSDNVEYPFSTREYPGAVWPEGYKYLRTFEKGFFPSFIYEILINNEPVRIKKTVAMLHNKNTVLICYEILSDTPHITLKLEPFVAARDYHSLTTANTSINGEVLKKKDSVFIQPYEGYPPLKIIVDSGTYHHEPGWYYQFEYEKEKERGLEFREDLFRYGYFTLDMKPGRKYFITVSTENTMGNPKKDFEAELERRKKLISQLVYKDPFIESLALAADQFIVRRGDSGSSIIAGYPWFTDWGRDTMIALPGLCLYTGRIAEAKKILLNYAEFVSEGMLPNRFVDVHNVPEYNTVDATLWYFIAIYQTYKASDDIELIKKLYPTLLEIINWHYRGTRYNIKVDKDGLLSAGEPGTQLTWMDAKIGDIVVTPRIGKAVEINALWYNALKITAEFAELLGDHKKSKEIQSKAKETAESFLKKFWNPDQNCLYDVLEQNKKDGSIRPNQILVLSLPFTLLPEDKALTVLDLVEKKLLTPYGLRTLNVEDENYQGKYIGKQSERDHAYHQGTVWAWLIGPYITACVRYRKETGKQEALQILAGLTEHLKEAGIGSVSEIFDGDPPHTPKGCPAQAWSVAEILRAYIEDIIE